MTIKNKQDELAFLRNKCKEHGMRVTRQKSMIYRTLLQLTDHPSPEQLFRRLNHTIHDISLDTIYRTLSAFNEIGVIDMVDGYGTARRIDPKLEKHHHFHCKNCGRIIDFKSDHYDKLEVPKDIIKECEVLKLRVTIDGLCKKCLKKRKRNNVK